MIFAGTAAIVTGGAVRIGREIGRRLAENGLHICVHYRSSERDAESAVREFQSQGVKAVAVAADLREPIPAAKKIVSVAREALGEVRVLINSAAIFEPGTLLNTDEENWDRHLTINLKSPFFLTQEFVRQLSPQQSAAVINIVDWRGTRPVSGHAAYTMAKGGLIAQTRLLAQELGPHVRVNGVAPGPILPLVGEGQEEFERRKCCNPLKRVGHPADIADAVLYLLNASFVTGEILHVTGGEELTTQVQD